MKWPRNPWFSVRDNDVFPEEFERFIRFTEPAPYGAEHLLP